MTFKQILAVLSLFIPIIATAANPPPTANVFIRDDQLWPLNPTTQTYDIPYCWENLAQIEANVEWNTRRKALKSLLKNTWGWSTRLNFYETSVPQCRPVGSLPLYTGIRIRVDPYKKVQMVSGRIMDSPYVLALGTKIKNRPDGVVLDLSAPFNSKIFKGCVIGASIERCINTATVHEFGHVIGMSHEQNRSDAVPGGTRCYDIAEVKKRIDSPVATTLDDLIFGNIRIGDYDLNSIMNYCNPLSPPFWTMSAIDIAAAKIFYGNMPAVLSPTGHTGLVGGALRTIILPAVYENGAPYRYELRETGQDTTPKDNIIDPVYKVITKTSLTDKQKPATVYPVTYNTLTRTIAIPTFKRVVNNTNVSDTNNGRVTIVGKFVLTRQANGTFILSGATKLTGVYSKIIWGK